MKIPLKFFAYAFFITFVIITSLNYIYISFLNSVTLGIAGGVIVCAFILGFSEREMKQDELIITSSNKNPEIPMKWYEQQIREQISIMRFVFSHRDGDLETYKSYGLYKIFEPDISMEAGPYMVRVTGSRLFIRIVSDITEVASTNEQTRIN